MRKKNSESLRRSRPPAQILAGGRLPPLFVGVSLAGTLSIITIYLAKPGLGFGISLQSTYNRLLDVNCKMRYLGVSYSYIMIYIYRIIYVKYILKILDTIFHLRLPALFL